MGKHGSAGKHARNETDENGGSAVKKHKTGWTKYVDEHGGFYWEHEDNRVSNVDPTSADFDHYGLCDETSDENDSITCVSCKACDDDNVIIGVKKKASKNFEMDAHCYKCAMEFSDEDKAGGDKAERTYRCPACEEWFHVRCMTKPNGEIRKYIKDGMTCSECQSQIVKPSRFSSSSERQKNIMQTNIQIRDETIKSLNMLLTTRSLFE